MHYADSMFVMPYRQQTEEDRRRKQQRYRKIREMQRLWRESPKIEYNIGFGKCAKGVFKILVKPDSPIMIEIHEYEWDQENRTYKEIKKEQFSPLPTSIANPESYLIIQDPTKEQGSTDILGFLMRTQKFLYVFKQNRPGGELYEFPMKQKIIAMQSRVDKQGHLHIKLTEEGGLFFVV
jgi:hypothetical protein